MGYYCISNAIIEGCENRIFQVCNRQLCYFFSIQSYGRAYPTPRGALPNMWGKYKRKTLVESKGVDRHVRLLPHAAWNAACSNHFLWLVEYAIEGSQFWLILVLPLVFIQFEVMKLLFHVYIFIDLLWLLLLAGRIWPLMRLSIFFDLFWNVQRFFSLRLNNPLTEVLGSYPGVFRGARFSSLTTNACSTENNIPFPNLANHIVLSKFWKLDFDRWVIQ